MGFDAWWLFWICTVVLVMAASPQTPLKLISPWSRIYAPMNWVRISSGYGLSLVRRQAITWTSAALLSIKPLATHVCEIWIKIKKIIHEDSVQNDIYEMAILMLQLPLLLCICTSWYGIQGDIYWTHIMRFICHINSNSENNGSIYELDLNPGLNSVIKISHLKLLLS